jgi:hypothetical protein
VSEQVLVVRSCSNTLSQREAMTAWSSRKFGVEGETTTYLASSIEAPMLQFVVFERILSFVRATEPARRVANLDGAQVYAVRQARLRYQKVLLAWRRPVSAGRLKRMPHAAHGRPRLAKFHRRSGVEGGCRVQGRVDPAQMLSDHLASEQKQFYAAVWPVGPRDSRANPSFFNTRRLSRTRSRRT